MRNAIERKDFGDVAYGCFIACLYALKVRRPFDEIAGHAKGFRIVVYQLKGTIVDEETFLLECMWEKLLWHMGRQLFFQSTPTIDCLHQLAEFAYPLSLSDYKSHAVWIQDSFQELELKMFFMRFLVSLDLQGTLESGQLKKVIVKQFWKDWTRGSTTLPNRTQIRRVMRSLWSGLLRLLCDLTQNPLVSPAVLDNTISSLYLAIDSIPEHDDITSTVEVQDLIDLARSCLFLIGLVVCEVEPMNASSIPCSGASLIVGFLSTRLRLENLPNGVNKELLSSFDTACCKLASIGREYEQMEMSRAVTAWVSICS
jgi:hypothetical protein